MARRVVRQLIPMLLVMVKLATLAGPARSQGTGRSSDIDTSIRAAGMGGAGAGVGWGAPGIWGNPAALARVRGLHWEHTRTQLVPGLAEDVFLDSDRALLGVPGLAVSSMGRPLGGLDLDYGESDVADISGTPIGTFRNFERVESRGVAVAAVGLVDGLRQLLGQHSDLAAFADIAYGIQRKHVEIQVAPGIGGETQEDVEDWGVVGRLSPIHPGFPTRNTQFTVDLGYGRSVLGANDATVTMPPVGPVPVSRIQRRGFAARASYRGGQLLEPRTGVLGLLIEGATPMLEVSYANDQEEIGQTVPNLSWTGASAPSFRVDRSGFELGVANMAFVRFGHVEDIAGDIVGDTFGWGLQLPFADVAGLRFDHATVPQARSSGLEDVRRNGWSAWFDPIAIMRRMRHRTASITS